jgi:hypothetical protein
MNLYQPTITGSLSVSGSINISGSITIAGGGTISGTASIATTALTASSADNLLVRNTLTAQTLVVQTITSSVDFVTGSTRFGSTGSNTHVFTGSILSNGGIGIGTSAITSGYSLDVNGPSYFRSSTTITGSGGMYYNIRTTSSADAAVFMFDGANTGYVGLNVGANPNKFVIYYAADTRMAIDTSGRVGFGTASPSYNLEISSGSSSPTELAIVNTNAAGAARLSLRNTERDFILTSNTADDNNDVAAVVAATTFTFSAVVAVPDKLPWILAFKRFVAGFTLRILELDTARPDPPFCGVNKR